MTGKERVEAVLGGRRPDRVPVMHISFSSRVASSLLGWEAYVGGGMQQWREATALWNGPDAHREFLERCVTDAIDVGLACGHDMVRPYYWRDRRKPAARIDPFTFRYEMADDSWEVKQFDPATELYNTVDSSARRETTLEDLELIVRREEESAATYEPTADAFLETIEVLKRVGDRLAVRAPGVLTCIPFDDPAWMEATVLRPDLVARLLEAQTIVSIRNVRFLAARGARIFFGGGDFASDRGPMYSPRVFRELVAPSLSKISDVCHGLGAWHLFGTDGNVWPVAEDLYGGSGIDGHYEFDRRAGMDVVSVHRRFPHIAAVGGISSHTLHLGSVRDVINEVRLSVEEAHATDKAVIGCSNLIVPETPPRNLEAMLRTIAALR